MHRLADDPASVGREADALWPEPLGEDAEVAAKAMPEFVEPVKPFNDAANAAGEGRAAFFDGLHSRAKQQKTGI